MVEYNIVKYCSMCRKRFVVEKAERKSIYCNSCQRKFSTRKAAVA